MAVNYGLISAEFPVAPELELFGALQSQNFFVHSMQYSLRISH